MQIIDNILISDDVLEQHFVCLLESCRGACCWEGDWGAPLEDSELEILKSIRESLRSYMSKEGNLVIDQEGSYEYFEEPRKFGTPLLKNGACAYLIYDQRNRGKCAMEIAFLTGDIHFQKPISCHLYPLRVLEVEEIGFTAINFDLWEICQPACDAGKNHHVPVYLFVKDALIRKFGRRFYQELAKLAEDQGQ